MTAKIIPFMGPRVPRRFTFPHALEQINGVVAAHPEAATYAPGDIFGVLSGTRHSETAGPDGAFSLDFTLVPGTNRIRLFASGTGGLARSFTGTNVELESRGVSKVPLGATTTAP